MTRFQWLRERHPAERRRLARRPWFEQLEDRLTPATFNVDVFADTVAANPSTGVDAQGHISLRSALMASNNLGGSNSINLPNGTYSLTLAGSSGPLTVAANNNLVLRGASTAAFTIIDGRNLNRAFTINVGATVTIQALSITQGRVQGPGAQGGGVFNAGQLTLMDVGIGSTTALGDPSNNAQGGAIFNAAGASLTIVGGSSVIGTAQGGLGASGSNGTPGINANQAGGSGTDGTDAMAGSNGGAGFGGAIYNDGGTVLIGRRSDLSARRSCVPSTPRSIPRAWPTGPTSSTRIS